MLAHPDVRDVLESIFQSINRESDRGAVLICGEIISDQLEQLLYAAAKSNATKKIGSKLLKYPGPLASFSAKLDVAYLAGYVPPTTYRAVSELKKLRNTAAHPTSGFNLLEEREQLHKVTQLGPGIPIHISNFVGNLLAKDMLDRAWEKKMEVDDSDEPIFKNMNEIIDVLVSSHPETHNTLCSLIIQTFNTCVCA